MMIYLLFYTLCILPLLYLGITKMILLWEMGAHSKREKLPSISALSIFKIKEHRFRNLLLLKYFLAFASLVMVLLGLDNSSQIDYPKTGLTLLLFLFLAPIHLYYYKAATKSMLVYYLEHLFMKLTVVILAILYFVGFSQMHEIYSLGFYSLLLLYLLDIMLIEIHKPATLLSPCSRNHLAVDIFLELFFIINIIMSYFLVSSSLSLLLAFAIPFSSIVVLTIGYFLYGVFGYYRSGRTYTFRWWPRVLLIMMFTLMGLYKWMQF